jgi:hypothetical protein
MGVGAEVSTARRQHGKKIDSVPQNTKLFLAAGGLKLKFFESVSYWVYSRHLVFNSWVVSQPKTSEGSLYVLL